MINRLGSILALEREAENDEPQIELSEIMEQGKEQIEYYLSGLNLEKDEWMREKIQQNEDGLIPVSVLMGCSRIKKIGILEDDLILACSTSKFLKVDKENMKIGRRKPFKSDIRRKYRTTHVKGFDEYVTIDDVYNAFSDTISTPSYILLQSVKTEEGDLIHSGTAIVEFENEAEAEKVCKASIYSGNHKIEIELLSDFEATIKKLSLKK